MFICRNGVVVIATETVLGSGEFGIVHPGIFQSEPVAIKTFKRSVEIDEFKAVLAELKIMAYMGDHEFIVKFIGAEISEIAKRKASFGPVAASGFCGNERCFWLSR